MLSTQRMRGSFAQRALLLCVLFLLFGPSSAPAMARYAPASPASRAEGVAASALFSVTVTTTSDTADGDTASFGALIGQPGADGAISLREAILASNAMTTTAPLSILFNIPTSDPGYDSITATWTIAVGNAALPPLAHGGVTIDGTSQPGSSGRPQIVLDGFLVFEADGLNNGLTLTSSGNTVRGLTLVNFWDSAVLISGPGAAFNQIVSSYLGPNATGGLPDQPSYFGVDVRDGAHDNVIGGDSTSERNLISANLHAGVSIQGPDTHDNIVAENWIGTSANGRGALKNDYIGVLVTSGAHHNTIGGAGQGNIISGNTYGIQLDGAVATTVAGNTIGLGSDHRTPLGNIDAGIFIVNGARDNMIGGVSASARNIISSNGSAASPYGQGIYIWHPTTENNTIQGNYIGVDSSGVKPAGNYRQGVLIGGDARANLIGGTAAGAGNVIAYNGLGGVRIDAPANQVVGNLIGLGADGATSLGNQFNGVRIDGEGNTVGPGNSIAFNQHSGVMLAGGSTTVMSNTIESNVRSGICVAGLGATISGNVIENNGFGAGSWADCDIRGGIVITGTDDLLVSDNRILGNNGPGVTVYGGRGNRILGNSISENDTAGINLAQGGNDEVPPPQIVGVVQTTISGSACPLCRVEVFTDTSDQGRHFVGATTAGADGSFSFQLAPAQVRDPHVTATHTDGSGNTSPFAPAVGIPGEGPPPTPTPTPLGPSQQPKMFLPLLL